MNSLIFWRVFWKEYRVQRAFWISIAVLTVLLLPIPLVFVSNSVDRLQWIFGLALGLPAFYAAGCGATLFATEHETGTFGFQKALPVSSRQLFLPKAAFGVISTLALMVLLWFVALLMTGWSVPPLAEHLGWWAMWTTAALELFVWGVLFSLLLQRPLRAALLGIGFGSFGMHWAASVVSPRMSVLQPDAYVAAVPLQLAIAAMVALIDIWTGARWLRESEDRPSGLWPLSARATSREAAGAEADTMPARGTEFGRLVWHQWRQSKGMLAVFGLMMVPLAVFYVGGLIRFLSGNYIEWTLPFKGTGVWEALLIWLEALAVPLAVLAVPLAGASVFQGDWRRGGHRFLAERGVRPSLFWLSRQLVWIVPVFFGALLLGTLFGLHSNLLFGRLLHRDGANAHRFLLLVRSVLALGAGVGTVLIVYSAGQLCSLLFRSPVLAGFFSVVLSGLILAWGMLMFHAGVPWTWSVLPIPLVLLMASWLRASGALLERNTLRAWLAPGLALALPTTVLLTAVPLYRVYSVPYTSPDFSPEEYARPVTPAELKTVAMYERAVALRVKWTGPLRPVPPEEATEDGEADAASEAQVPAGPLLDEAGSPTSAGIQWLKANQEALQLALEASRRADADYSRESSNKAIRAGGDLVIAGLLRTGQGQLDEALEYYLAALRVAQHARQKNSAQFSVDSLEDSVYRELAGWAAHEDQTAERIANAVNQIADITRGVAPRDVAIKNQYLLLRQLIDADPDAFDKLNVAPAHAFRIYLWYTYLPWERTRAIRLLDRLTALDMQQWQAAVWAVEGSRPCPYPHWNQRHRRVRPREWPQILRTTPVHRFFYAEAHDQIQGLVSMETKRRATRLVLALAAWKLEHGELPERLDALEGRYLDAVPLDPVTGQLFRYFPDGLPRSVKGFSPLPLDGSSVIPAGNPCVWSAGRRVRCRDLPRSQDTLLQRFAIVDPHDPDGGARQPTSEFELWKSGWVFPIPRTSPKSSRSGAARAEQNKKVEG